MYNQMKAQAHSPIREPLEFEADDEDDEDKRTIFCANIDQRVTEEILFEVFLQAGPIESVRIPRDNGGRQKTFGFITYVHRCSVPFALNLLAGLSLYKKSLTIKTKCMPNLPSDCRVGGGGGSGSFRDNLALRGNTFGSHCDENPFKRDLSPPKRVEWGVSRRSDELKKHSSHNSRPHQNTPYSRDHGGGGYQKRHNNNRRSEQRNRHR